MASRKKKEKAFNVLAFFIVLILAALVLLPIWWIFRSSLMSTAALNEYPPSFIPHEWLWSNYSKALETFEYWTYFKNTFTIIIPAVTFGTITAIFCGYAFARLRFRGKKLIFNICVGTILLPGMVTLIPLYIFWTKGMGLGDTYWPLILPFLTGGGFFNIFLIRQFLMTIPKELDEAASIDGAGRMRKRGFETIKSAVHMHQKWCAAVALAGACFLRCLQLRSVSACERVLREVA